MSTALRQLRSATAEVHQRLEDRLAVFQRCAERQSYASLLERFWHVHSGLEPALASAAAATGVPWRRDDVLGRLTRDLADLGVEAGLRHDLPPLPLTSADDVWGCLYVVEGAALGGALISAEVQRIHGGRLPCRFFTGPGDARGRRWREFRRLLSAELEVRADRAAVQASATRTFALFELICADRREHAG